MAALTEVLNFDVGDTVYHISEENGVRKAIVKNVMYAKSTAGESTQYAVQFVNTMFGSLSAIDQADLDSNVDLALATYKARYLV